MSPRARIKFSFSQPVIRTVEFPAEDCPIPLENYLRDDGSLDYTKMPEAEFQVFSDWALEKNPRPDVPSERMEEIAQEIGLPVKIVECAFVMSQFASVPNLDLSKSHYKIPTDLGHLGALREDGGKLPRFENCLASSVKEARNARSILEAGFENQFCGTAEPKGTNFEAPNPILGHVLIAADESFRLNSLLGDLDDVIERMDEVLGELAALAKDAREKSAGRGGNTCEPDWMIWVARLFDHHGIGKEKYMELVLKMEAGDSGKSAWKRANSQSTRDLVEGEGLDSPLPPIPWGANVPLYESLGGRLFE